MIVQEDLVNARLVAERGDDAEVVLG